MATLAEVWDELDFEERATVGPLTRVRIGLDADPLHPTPRRYSSTMPVFTHDDDACEAEPCDDCLASADAVCDPIQEV